MSKIEKGQTVNVHYTGTFEDGTVFDSSRDRGEPITVEVGSGQLIAGFDNALSDMNIGETRNVKLTPEEGYGHRNPDLFHTLPQSNFPEGFEFVVGASVTGQDPNGRPMFATISSIEGDNVILDFNHP